MLHANNAACLLVFTCTTFCGTRKARLREHLACARAATGIAVRMDEGCTMVHGMPSIGT